ncbi:hypothetical protein HKX48_005171 [Thoreauomyces humboldtii]|nr:hypothetical protein HKX48_005171 [Thoreauomyces humboldtii]
MVTCAVCNDKEQRYKCPSCGLDCYKKHKASCDVPPPADTPATVTPNPQGKATHIEDEDEAHKLNDGQLARLVESKHILDLVSDPQVRDLLLTLDTAPNAEAVYDQALLANPRFQEFIDRALEAVGQVGGGGDDGVDTKPEVKHT